MAWQIPIANTSVEIILGAAESLYVAKPIVIAARVKSPSGSNQQVIVDGTIAVAGTAIWFDSTTGSGNTVTVNEGGVVRAFGNTGVAFSSAASTLENKGYVSGDYGVIFLALAGATTTSTLNNSGIIDGDLHGVQRQFTTETITVVNSGTISGGVFSFAEFSTVGGRDLITNTGRMIGDIGLGVGNDIYSGAAGRLTGKVFAGAGTDTITGGLDNDWFEGGADNDILRGNSGNDRLDGGLGADSMFGGIGNDTYLVGNLADIVNEAGGNGIDQVLSSISFNLIGAVENLTLFGTAAINGTGNFLNNVITGNAVNNILSGSLGIDTLNGSAGNDVLIGGGNKDTMTGGAGTDDFDFNVVSEMGKTATTRDVITDFTVGDDIDLSTIDANGAAAGNTAFSFLAANGAAFTGVAGQLRWQKFSSLTLVEGDINGDRVADFQVQLTGSKNLTASDFVL